MCPLPHQRWILPLRWGCWRAVVKRAEARHIDKVIAEAPRHEVFRRLRGRTPCLPRIVILLAASLGAKRSGVFLFFSNHPLVFSQKAEYNNIKNQLQPSIEPHNDRGWTWSRPVARLKRRIPAGWPFSLEKNCKSFPKSWSHQLYSKYCACSIYNSLF